MKNKIHFQTGDWVKESYNTFEKGEMVEKFKTFKLLRESDYDEGYFLTSQDLNSNELCIGYIKPQDTWKLWTPVKNQLCIFHNGISFPATLGVINPSYKQEKENYVCLGIPGKFNFCEPFIKESVIIFEKLFEN